MSLRTRGVVACAAVLLLSGCGSAPIEVDAPDLSAAEARACRDLVADLPDTELNYRPRVALYIPGGYRPEGFSDSIATVGPLIERHLTKTGSCL